MGRSGRYRDMVWPMDVAALEEHRSAKDEFFGDSGHSPLTPGDQRGFSGLAYFDPNPDLVFTLSPEPADGSVIRVQTSDGQERDYRREATVLFEVNSETTQLTLYTTGHPGYFIPFRDKTSGAESYGAGRYLDVDPNEDGTVTIDFNLAYNPYCAYNEAYSCPLPPHENWLQVPIEAGEQDYKPRT